MIEDNTKDILRGNPKLKAPNSSELVSYETLSERMEELDRIIADPVYFGNKYFYIISVDNR